jgi:O-antigen/teichoic acid export membrane protein
VTGGVLRASAEGLPAAGARTLKLAGDVAVMVAGWLLRLALGLALSIVLARSLGPAEMGRYSFLVWLAGLLPMLLSLGLPAALTRHTAQAVASGRPAVAGGLLVGALAIGSALGLAAFAAIATSLSVIEEAWHVPLLLAGASVPLLVLHGTLSAFFSGLGLFRVPAALGAAQLALLLALVGVAAAAQAGLAAVLAAHAVANLAALAFLGALAWRAGRRRGALPPAAPPAALRAVVLRYAGSVSLLVAVDAIVWQRTELAFLQTLSTADQVAFYALAFGLVSQATRIPYHATVALFPSFTELAARGRQAELASLFETATRYHLLAGAPLVLGLAAVAPAAVGALFGPAYAPAAPVLVVLALGSVVTVAAGASPSVLHATNHQDRLVYQGMAAAVVNVAAALVLVPAAGALGAALANVLAQVLGAALGIRAAILVAGTRLATGPLARIAGAAALMAVPAAVTAVSLDGVLGLAVGVLVGAVGYPLALRALRALSAEDLDRLTLLAQSLPPTVRRPGLGVAAFLCGAPVARVPVPPR